MRKHVIHLICAALLMNGSVAFAKDRAPGSEGKDYKIRGGMLTPPPVVTYDGPVLPRESTALLIQAENTRINSIDGQRIDDQGKWVNFLKNPGENSNVFQLMPGKHLIGVSYASKMSPGGTVYNVYSKTYVEIELDADKGHVYLANANGVVSIKTKWRGPDDVEGSFNPTITNISDALDSQENQNLDGCFKNSKKIYRVSEWLAARQKAASENRLHGSGRTQERQSTDGVNSGFEAVKGQLP